MLELTTPSDCFYLADDGETYVAGPLETGQHVTTGYTSLALYPTLDALNAALVAAGQPPYVPEG